MSGVTVQERSHGLRICQARRREDSQPDEGENEQQQQQPVNHSSDNAEIARNLTSFSHPGCDTMRALFED